VKNVVDNLPCLTDGAGGGIRTHTPRKMHSDPQDMTLQMTRLLVILTMSRLKFLSIALMNGGDLYELAKILGHSNIKMTERYAKPGRKHIAHREHSAEIRKPMENGKRERGTRGLRMFSYCSRD
jgi:integrase